MSTRCDGIVLSGGSAYGLRRRDGVMAVAGGARPRLRVGGSSSRSCLGAILFDLNNGGDKDWGEAAALPRAGVAPPASMPERTSRSAMPAPG